MNKDKRLLFDSPTKGDLHEQQKPQFDLSMTTEVVCEKCGSKSFTKVYSVRRVPKIMTGAPKDLDAPFLSGLKCTECGAVMGQKPTE